MKSSIKNIHRLIEQTTTATPLEESFVADLTNVIERVEADNERPSSNAYKPSSMQCIRQMYFIRTGAEKDNERADSNLIGMGQTGTFRHDTLQEAIGKMKEYGVDCEYVDVAEYIKKNNLPDLEIIERQGHELKLYNKKLKMRFLCDGIIKYRGEYYILEIKTETIYKFQRRTGVAPEHITQGTAYATNFNIDKVMFLYEDRNSSGKKAYILKITDEMKQRLVINKIAECEEYVQRGEVPPLPNNLPKNVCQYCPYKTACEKAGGPCGSK